MEGIKKHGKHVFKFFILRVTIPLKFYTCYWSQNIVAAIWLPKGYPYAGVRENTKVDYDSSSVQVQVVFQENWRA